MIGGQILRQRQARCIGQRSRAPRDREAFRVKWFRPDHPGQGPDKAKGQIDPAVDQRVHRRRPAKRQHRKPQPRRAAPHPVCQLWYDHRLLPIQRGDADHAPGCRGIELPHRPQGAAQRLDRSGNGGFKRQCDGGRFHSLGLAPTPPCLETSGQIPAMVGIISCRSTMML